MAWEVPSVNWGLGLQDGRQIAGVGEALLGALDRRKKNRMEADARAAFANGLPTGADGSPDYAAMAARLFGAGDIETGMGLTRLAETQSQNLYNRGFQQQQFAFQQQNAMRDDAFRQQQFDWQATQPREVAGALVDPQTYQPVYQAPPDPAKLPAGFQATPEGGMQFVPGGPADPQVIADQNRARLLGRPRSAADSKAIWEAEENLAASEAVINSLGQALELSPRSLSGPAADSRSYAGSVMPDWALPGSRDAAVDTQNLKNLVTAQALDQLKSTFGSMPTEGERKILLEIQGSVNQAPEVREEIYRRAMKAAQNRIEFNRRRLQELKGQDPENIVAAPGQADAPPPDGVDPDDWRFLTPEERASW